MCIHALFLEQDHPRHWDSSARLCYRSANLRSTRSVRVHQLPFQDPCFHPRARRLSHRPIRLLFIRTALNKVDAILRYPRIRRLGLAHSPVSDIPENEARTSSTTAGVPTGTPSSTSLSTRKTPRHHHHHFNANAPVLHPTSPFRFPVCRNASRLHLHLHD